MTKSKSNAFKIAGFGLLAAATLTIASAGMATANGRGGSDGNFGPRGPHGPGDRGGIFATAFADLDADGNGLITEEDLQAQADGRFAEVDTDGNGTLSIEELAAQAIARMTERMEGQTETPRGFDPETASTKMAERMLQQRDADADGVLSMAEMGPDKGFGRIIDRFDTDDDNAISQAEYDEVKAEMEARFAERGDRGDRGNGGKRW